MARETQAFLSSIGSSAEEGNACNNKDSKGQGEG